MSITTNVPKREDRFMADYFSEQFPYLCRLCKEENVERIPYVATHQQLILRDYVVSKYPKRLEAKINTVRHMLNECIGLAYKHNALNADRRHRISGTDSIRFWSLINELRVGLWLCNQGLKIRFDPIARDGRIGEFEIASDNRTAFIEVKTIFGDREMLAQDELVSTLADHFETKKMPVGEINLVEYPGDINRDSILSLIENIDGFLCPYFADLAKEIKVEYNDSKGLIIEFTLSPGTFHVFSTMYGGVFGVENQLKYKLGIQVEGKRREVQVSTKDIPNIVIIYDSGCLTSEIIDGILYGSMVFRVHKRESEAYFRENNGLWDINIGNTISAVGVFKETLNAEYNLKVQMYLCPKPDFPLNTTLFHRKDIKWLSLSSDGYSIKEN